MKSRLKYSMLHSNDLIRIDICEFQILVAYIRKYWTWLCCKAGYDCTVHLQELISFQVCRKQLPWGWYVPYHLISPCNHCWHLRWAKTQFGNVSGSLPKAQRDLITYLVRCMKSLCEVLSLKLSCHLTFEHAFTTVKDAA